MIEYSKDVIADMVSDFMSAYKAEVEKNGLGLARGFADKYLMDLSKDMPEDASALFVKTCMKPLNTFLQEQMDTADTAVQELTDEPVA